MVFDQTAVMCLVGVGRVEPDNRSEVEWSPEHHSSVGVCQPQPEEQCHFTAGQLLPNPTRAEHVG